MKNVRIVLMLILVVILPISINAETWPTLDQYVKWCVLIVKCRTEIEGETIKYKVIETWKGKYSPDLFYNKPEEGYLYTNTWHGNENPREGREVIFFFTSPKDGHSWANGKIVNHSTSFVVEEGKLIYASTNRSLRKVFTLEEFKKEILKIVKQEQSIN